MHYRYQKCHFEIYYEVFGLSIPAYAWIVYQNPVYWLLSTAFCLYLPLEIRYRHLHVYKIVFNQYKLSS